MYFTGEGRGGGLPIAEARAPTGETHLVRLVTYLPGIPLGEQGWHSDELLHDRGGNTPEESLEVIKLAEEAGIDCLSVTAGWQESAVSVISRDCPQGSWLHIAERMKQNLKVPVAMAYRLF